MVRGKRSIASLWSTGFTLEHRVSLPMLALAAVVSVSVWLTAEASLGQFTHPASAQMQLASRIMQAASQVARAEKRERGLLQPIEVDPNQTGLIGPEFTDITTSLGVLEAKRTATNPDLAAALTARIAEFDLPEDSVVVALFSGSMVGANVAALAATQALGLETVIVSSLGASMFGATDPDFTWLDIEAALRAGGATTGRSDIALIGGNGAVGRGLSEEGLAAIRASIARSGVPLLEAETLPELLGELEARIDELTGKKPALFINAGGSVAAFGTCQNANLIPAGLSHTRLHCADGMPGLIVSMSQRDVPVVHLLNMRGLAADWGLPYDPIPFDLPGNNVFVYGSGH
ncbi:MAG TPA: poly-gamma-glutamate system protein [Pelagibacterium sp.]|uniref:poly-gamma-glutamate system protein n=1 Tax=Pelagibacterium sp. TaxID=1967288 RepID=UPI002D08DFCF|nr:poly-gamma-glutamate system protein [Pelagibacterium sp.]HWJ88289.1 poly-gamma-glutamate system protein [Pelagibacterium sp.]